MMTRNRLLHTLVICCVVGTIANAQTGIDSEPASKPEVDRSSAPVAADALPVEQARLADRFKRLEEVIGRLAELSMSTDPRRARLLREAIARSREQDLNVRFDAIVKLLEEERLSAAATNQTELQAELNELLVLLLKADRDNELASQRERVRKYLREVGRLIRLQKGVRARTQGGDEFKPLSQDQQRIAADTGKLGGNVEQTDGAASRNADSEAGKNKDGAEQPDTEDSKRDDKSETSDRDQNKPGQPESKKPGDESQPSNSDSQSKPSEGQSGEGSQSKPSDGPPAQPGQSQGQQNQQGQPGQQGESGENGGDQQPRPPQDPANRAVERLRAAQQQMEQARKQLDDAQREGAAQRQREALQALEQARADLERILRQLREEELERTLTQLAARFKKMLESQIQVHEGTIRLEEVPAADRDHDDEIEAARLSRQEAQIMFEADKCLLLLREEGSSVAFPETVELMRDDMRQVVKWLAELNVGKMTQTVEEEIIAALEETIAALEKARKDLEKNRMRPGQQSSGGQPGEPRLVDEIAELKMIRTLQMRIYQRTQRFGKMIEGEQAESPELLEALRELAERQERVYRATADLQQGRND